ncbi:HHL058Cp [Eremothecium sinecaudum]|uniref:Trafficking protein particle complex subunit n=1 Tax=Eremothecium sinecaudum TaxID=45286 RepID=A0A120K2V4_9SACH|nr:HHL058Cp [Eremothecium sinecaudum]AMD22712.1 HHL058Cp [Eremothecium sinecaudum]
MAIKSLFIINKSGGLVYHRDFIPSPKEKLSSNEHLILAGTLHSVVAIASQLTPKALQLSKQASNSQSVSANSNGGAAGASAAVSTNGSSLTLGPADHVIPYVPGVGTEANGNCTPGQPIGSYLAPDYFSESFPSWNKSGLKNVVTDDFSFFVYQALTGIKFVLVSTQRTTSNRAIQIAENILRKVYCIYSDYVMKNPFYSVDMAIRNEPFDKKLQALVESL